MPARSIIGHAETVIVGAGIVGSALAFHFARMGHRDVLVLDRGRLDAPGGSTGHAPGLLGRNAASPVLSALACDTAALLAELPVEAPALTRVGSIEVVRQRSRLGDLAHKLDVAQARGLTASLLSSDEVGERVPYLDRRVVAGGLFLPDDGVMDVKRGLRAIQAEASGLGATFREATEIVGVAFDGDRVTGVVTPEGVIGCGRVVIAIGIWAPMLLEGLGISLPIIPVQHPYVTTEPLPELAGAVVEAAHPFVRDVERLLYLREHGDRLGFGWFNHEPVVSDARSLQCADLPFPDRGPLDAVRHDLVPTLAQLRHHKRLNGLLAMTPDGLPLIGPIAGRPGLWIAEAIWVTHACGAGRALAERILGHTPWLDLTSFAPHRFADRDAETARRESLKVYNDIYSWDQSS